MENNSFFESGIMRFLTKFVDLVALNLLTIFCSIPIFTIGCSVTALHYAIRKIQQGDERIFRMYFHSFKQNFRQATIIWIILLITGGGIYCNYSFFNDTSNILSVVFSIVSPIIWLDIALWIFPLLSMFSFKTKDALRNVAILSISYWPFTLVMLLINIFPLFLFFRSPALFIRHGYIWLFIWISLSVFCFEHFFVRIMKPLQTKYSTETDPDQDTPNT